MLSNLRRTHCTLTVEEPVAMRAHASYQHHGLQCRMFSSVPQCCIRSRSRLCLTAAAGAAAAPVPPAAPSNRKMQLRLQQMYEDTHQAMLELDARVLDVPWLWKHTYYFRHPDDINAILSKDGQLFAKSRRVAQSKEFLGQGLFSQLDATKHAVMRQTLNPAFRMEYLKQLDRFFVSSAMQLADILQEAAADADAASNGSGNSNGNDSSSNGSSGTPLDFQRMFRLMTLDSIGLTSMQYDFAALSSWQQQQQQQPGAANGVQQIVLIEQMLQHLSKAFVWQALCLPVPRSWLPGYSNYMSACNRLDGIVEQILHQRRAKQADTSSSGGGSSSSSTGSGGSRSSQDIVGYLLQAQQQQGCDAISDAAIGDEVKTMIFGGSDTSSFTLAVLAHYLASHPEAAERAAGEVAALLQDTGRAGDMSQLCAEDAARLPFVTACVKETLRLSPAGPTITRTACRDTEVAGYTVHQGQDVVAHVYAMQRHPEIWPQPTAWLPQRWLPEGVGQRLAPTSKNAFLPFSTGARSCIGRSYAMLQMVLSMAVLLGRGIRFRFAEEAASRDLRVAKGLSMYAEDGVWLVPTIE